jgi:ABC-2 type transport system permease protein
MRYLRLLGAFARFGLASELAFRGNFLVKLLVELLWLGILLVFYRTIFARTDTVADWSEPQFLFFLGCYFALEGVIETFFLENCSEFSDLIRSGNLDLYLLKPMDEQFLVTCRKLDWSTLPNIFLGGLVMAHSLWRLEWAFDPWQLAMFVVFFVAGVALAYSFLIILMATAVWMVRNQSLMELWWLCTTVMRYPSAIYSGSWGAMALGWFFTYMVPMLLVVNVPAQTMVKLFDPTTAGLMLVATVVMLWLSRRFFKRALQSYRSASS